MQAKARLMRPTQSAVEEAFTMPLAYEPTCSATSILQQAHKHHLLVLLDSGRVEGGKTVCLSDGHCLGLALHSLALGPPIRKLLLHLLLTVLLLTALHLTKLILTNGALLDLVLTM